MYKSASNYVFFFGTRDTKSAKMHNSLREVKTRVLTGRHSSLVTHPQRNDWPRIMKRINARESPPHSTRYTSQRRSIAGDFGQVHSTPSKRLYSEVRSTDYAIIPHPSGRTPRPHHVFMTIPTMAGSGRPICKPRGQVVLTSGCRTLSTVISRYSERTCPDPLLSFSYHQPYNDF